MSANEPGGPRTFDTADPAEHERLRLAWDNFEHMLTPGFVASDLNPAYSAAGLDWKRGPLTFAGWEEETR